MTIQHRHEMSDAEVTAIRERTDAFIDAVGVAITDAIAAIDPASPCAAEARRGLARISATLRDVDYVMMTNLATLDHAMKRRVGTGLLPIIATHLLGVGGGPSLDYKNAAEFMQTFAPMIEMALKRRVN